MQVFFTQFTSLSKAVVKHYKSDFTKSIGASMHLARYQCLQVPDLRAFDAYLNGMSPYETITLGLTLKENGISKTAKAYDEAEAPDFIFRGKGHVQALNDVYPTAKDVYSLYFFDVDYDEAQPEHFKMATPEEVRASLIKLIPALETVGMLIRPSSSAGIYNTLTGEKRTDKPSWHIYIVVANARTETFANLTEYIKRRANCKDVNLAYTKISKSGAKLERFYIDLAVADPSRLIVEATPTLDYPLAKKMIESTIIEGDVLDLDSINIDDEDDYRDIVKAITSKKIMNTINIPHATQNTVYTTPTNRVKGGVILITDDDKDKVMKIYKYFKQTKKPKVANIRDMLSQTLVTAILIFLGFEVNSNFKFKMRDETTASASISHQAFIKDFGSSFSGDIISFMMEVYSLKFIEAWTYFQNLFGMFKKLSIKTQVALPDAKAFEKSLTTIK